ncbi:DnaJ domain-containing protein [Elioraea rosea]|uniref:DnaJ domain-containing protein n=1 Tax=Elioraea rosea TaxID=2492390 RepID=UPI001185390A|nr:DnaJ domain-containing protein [Elioraea rosea]
MTWLLVGLGALGLIFYAASAFANARIEALKSALKWVGITLGGALALFLLVTGRGGQALMLAVVLGPLAIRFWNQAKAARTFSRGGRPGEGQASEVATAFLRMRLDHDTGTMSGTVLAGEFRGRELAELALPDLIALWLALRAEDPESVPLLEAWMDRRFGEAWRGAAADAAGDSEEGPRAAGGPLTRAEAFAILGLREGATEEQIRDAHRRLMRAAHPDKGGSDWLAARINEARDVLLG